MFCPYLLLLAQIVQKTLEALATRAFKTVCTGKSRIGQGRNAIYTKERKMGAGCGGACEVSFDGTSNAFKKALWLVIAINGAMFMVEMMAGFMGRSMALKADALDFLGDTLTYGISMWAIGKSAMLRAKVAMLKGISLAGMGLFVLAATLWRFFFIGQPDEMVMGAIGAMALSANLLSVLILMKYRDGDANVRSVWLCSRNDAIGNLAVLAAAWAVFYTASPWPDLIVAFFMAALFLNSASQIIKKAREEMVQNKKQGAEKSQRESCCSGSQCCSGEKGE
jgi:Co/Zn/Cd efflux system component